MYYFKFIKDKIFIKIALCWCRKKRLVLIYPNQSEKRGMSPGLTGTIR